MQWLALSKTNPSQSASQYNTHPYQPQHHGYNSHHQPYKSHWTLINEFIQLPEDEIETFLPQVVNIILDQETPDTSGIYDSLQRSIVQKCAKNLPFGLKVSHLLRAASSGPSESIFRSVLSNPLKEAREARLMEFQAMVDQATFCGYNLSDKMRYLRSTYCQDYLFMISSLSRLGTELKHSPGDSMFILNSILQ